MDNRHCLSDTVGKQNKIEGMYSASCSDQVFLVQIYRSKARFKRRISHVPNLIQELYACEVRSLNQLNSADLN